MLDITSYSITIRFPVDKVIRFPISKDIFKYEECLNYLLENNPKAYTKESLEQCKRILSLVRKHNASLLSIENISIRTANNRNKRFINVTISFNSFDKLNNFTNFIK